MKIILSRFIEDVEKTAMRFRRMNCPHTFAGLLASIFGPGVTRNYGSVRRCSAMNRMTLSTGATVFCFW